MRAILLCGHEELRIDDYADDYRWVVRCETCGDTGRWTQRQWREHLLGQITPPEDDSVEVAADFSARLPVF